MDPNGLAVLMFTLKNIRKIIKEKYDIVIPINGGWQPALLRIATWLYGGKLVISGHSGVGWDDINNLWCFPDVFVALSEKSEKWAKKINPFIRIVKIVNGVDIEKFSPSGSKENLNLPKPVIISVGALEKQKRFGLVIKAVAKLKKGSLLILGKGDEEDNIKKIGKRLLGKRFMLKNVSYETIDSYYRSADMFTSASSSFYAFELVIIEAMASNLPVVVNSDPIRKEIVKGAGFLVNPEDVDSYADCLRKAVNKSWDRIPRKIAEYYSWENVSKAYEILFSDVIKK